jgi:hypothetical protein
LLVCSPTASLLKLILLKSMVDRFSRS